MSLPPCTSPSDYSSAGTVRFGGTVGSAYSPACVIVNRSDSLTFDGSFGSHPLSPGSGGSAGNPIPPTSTGSSLVVSFPTTGFYPFYCAFHGSAGGGGMAGVVQVR